MSVDPHEFRMAAGNTVFDSIDLMDKQGIGHCEEFMIALRDFVEYLEEQGVPGVQVMSSVAGMVTGWMYRRQEASVEVEGQP